MKMNLFVGSVLGLFAVLSCNGQDTTLPKLGDSLTDAQVVAFAKLALDGMHTPVSYTHLTLPTKA